MKTTFAISAVAAESFKFDSSMKDTLRQYADKAKVEGKDFLKDMTKSYYADSEAFMTELQEKGSKSLTSGKKCGTVDVEPDFVLDNYLGTWYELYRDIPSYWYKGDCVMTHYSPKKTDEINVENTLQEYNDDGSF